MDKLTCASCAQSMPYSSNLRHWKCRACSLNLSPQSLSCILCGLRGGLFLQAGTEWVHILCSQLFKECTMYDRLPSTAKDFLDSNIAIDRVRLLMDECFLCKSANGFPVIPCKLCLEKVHVACAINRNWLINDQSFICGCQKLKVLPSIRAPTFPTAAQRVIQSIIKADYLRFFETHKPSKLSKKRLEQLHITLELDSSRNKVQQILPNEPLPTGKTSPKKANSQSSKNLESLLDISCYNVASASQLLEDISELTNNRSAKHPEYSAYIQEFYENARQIIKSHEKNLNKALDSDWKRAVNDNELATQVQGEWNKDPQISRPYELIPDYYPVDPNTCSLERLQTSKKGNCNGKSCSNLNDLGPLDLLQDTWQSENTDRFQKIECGEDCRCARDRCKNRQISLRQGLELGTHVLEKPTWGFDNYTYRMILAYTILDENYTHFFIGSTLPKAINAVTKNNFDIRNALKHILKEDLYVEKDKKLAFGLLRSLDGLIEIYGESEVLSHFKIHSKGIGVVNLCTEGIPANSLITPYLGELFSPAKWYEKQDIIKSHILQLNKKNKALGFMPDFYNIMLEKHRDDPGGYDVLVVDPIAKGNFGSRLSHSCTPNCGTVTMVANGRYYIGMYSLKKIDHLEELTFDYHSYTESYKEHIRAVCLCASPQCRAHFLEHISSNTEMPTNFLGRLSIAIRSTDLSLSEEMLSSLSEFGIKEVVLARCPEWLKVWVYLICDSILQESLKKKSVFEQKNLINDRLLNLVISTDKIKYCLRGATNPPYRIMSKSEILEYLWGNSEHSVRSQLASANENTYKCVKGLLSVEIDDIKEVRFHILKIRDRLREEGSDDWHIKGIADMLHFIAFTKLFYTELQYPSFKSASVPIMPHEVNQSVLENATKSYSNNHIHGIMTGWFKQTVEQPGASYSAEKRGTTNVASLSSGKNKGQYTQEIRNQLLKHLENRHFSSWPHRKSKNFPWVSFNSPGKIYGTPMLDKEYFKDDSLEVCLAHLDIPAENCQILSDYEIHNF